MKFKKKKKILNINDSNFMNDKKIIYYYYNDKSKVSNKYLLL